MTLIDKWTREKAFKLFQISSRMNLCSCGTDTHWECVLEVLEDASSGPGVHRKIWSDPWFEFSAKVLDGWGLLEHGGSIGGAWLTNDGKLLLEFLRDFGVTTYIGENGEGHPEWAGACHWELELDGDCDAYQAWVDFYS